MAKALKVMALFETASYLLLVYFWLVAPNDGIKAVVGFVHGLIWLSFVAMVVMIKPEIGWSWGYALVVVTGPIGGVLVCRGSDEGAASSPRTSRIASGRSSTATAGRRRRVHAPRNEEHAPRHRLAGGLLERERVRRALQPVAGELGVEVGVARPRVGLVVDDHQPVVGRGTRGRRSPRAWCRRPARRRTSRGGSRGRPPRAPCRSRARSGASAAMSSSSPMIAFGRGLGGGGGVDAVAGREVDRLEHRVHRAPDRGAVAALVPRRQLEVARLLGQAGVARPRRRRSAASPRQRGGGARRVGRRRRPSARSRRRATRPRRWATAPAPAAATRRAAAVAGAPDAVQCGASSAACHSSSAWVHVVAVGRLAPAPVRCTETTRWSRARVPAT